MKLWAAMLGLMLLLPLGAAAQPLLRFHVAEFGQDQFDLSGRTAPTAQKDGDGNLYAIIKVYATNPDDRLPEYRFNFGLLDSKSEMHDGVLWLYVQKGAKTVTISRDGYARVERYDLGGSLQPGSNYVMRLSSQASPLNRQMLHFITDPPVSGAVILITPEGGSEESFGRTDDTGSYANSLPYGTYTYRIVAADHDTLEGYVTLNDSQLRIEKVTLAPHFINATLDPGMDCEILLNDKPYTTTDGLWTGPLKYGQYYVVCRKPGHRDTHGRIVASPDGPTTFALESPIPITGRLAITSDPTGAQITIDGQDYGVTPKVLDLLIGEHHLQLSKVGMATYHKDINITEGTYDEFNTSLDESKIVNITSKPTDAEIIINGHNYGHTPISGIFEKGKYNIQLKKDKYLPYDEKVTLDPAKPDVLLKMEKKRLATFYAQVGIEAGAMFGPTISFGTNIKRVNIELYGNLDLIGEYYECSYNAEWTSLETFTNYVSKHEERFIPLSFGCKIGYNIPIKKRLIITPRIGLNAAWSVDDFEDYCGSIAVDVRLSYKLSSRVSLVAVPQCRHFIYQSPFIKRVTENINKIRKWGSGANITIGLAFNF